MGTASFSFDAPSIPLARQAAAVFVARFDASAISGSPYTILPNVVCEDVQIREGADPGSARFRYILDDSNPALPWPDGFEDLYSIDATGRYVVQNDTRLVVIVGDQDGLTVVFDGFAQIPEVSVGPESQSVTFQAIGVAVRLWDTPIGGARMQDADAPSTAGSWEDTDLPVRFNPNDGEKSQQPNRTPDGYRVPANNASFDYPIFLDPRIDRDPDPRAFWTLSDAVQYLIWRGNPNEFYVKNGNTADLDNTLRAIKPKNGDTYNPLDPTTYDLEPIVVRDFDASNRPWIESVDDLVSAYGFRVNFTIDPDGEGDPKTTIRFSRRDGAFSGAPASVYLQPKGSDLDPGQSNVRDIQLTRDLAEAYNEIEIETDPCQYEASFVLAPGWSPDAADVSTKNKYTRATIEQGGGVADRFKYRLFIFDEGGDGHWDFKSSSFVDDVPSLVNVLSLDKDGNPPADGKATYVNRYRPGQYELLSTDDGKPLRARLDISYDYSGVAPAVWDGQSGNWQPVSSSWQLLHEKLGVYLTPEDISKWDVGAYNGPNKQVHGPGVNVLVSMANPTATGTANARFFLRLTTVIDGDRGIGVKARKRSASPTKFVVRRRIDCRDHFRIQRVNKSSPFYNITESFVQDSGDQYATRDDTKAAQAYADAIRSAHEFPQTAGSIAIPRLTAAYPIGTRIAGISGRSTTFKINAGDQTEGNQYPTVVAIRYVFGARQETILQLSDRRAEPLRA